MKLRQRNIKGTKRIEVTENYEINPVFMKPTFETRVKEAKKLLKSKGVKNSKVKFFDSTFGAMFKSESIRMDNLWAGYIVDEDFTEKLESFAKNPDESSRFVSFLKFVEWYLKLGGKPLTETEIEDTFKKF
jgi:hypothetical protein